MRIHDRLLDKLYCERRTGQTYFPAGITGPVTGTVLGNIGGLARPNLFSEIFRQNDTLYAYISNRDNANAYPADFFSLYQCLGPLFNPV